MNIHSIDFVPETAEEYFEKVLPGAIEGIVGHCTEGVGSIVHVLDDGAVWSTWLEAGHLVSRKERRADTLVEITCVKGSWREIVTLGKPEHAAKILSDARTAAMLRKAKGTLLRKIVDRGLVYGATIGGGTPNVTNPRLILEMTMEDHFRMNAGDGVVLLPGGGVKVYGDLYFLAELAAALE